jgi:minor extracellular serine protease Vpr
MKKGILYFTLFFSFLLGNAQVNQTNKLSANLMQLLSKPNAINSSNKAVLSKIKGETFVSTLIKVTPQINEKSITQLGAYIGTKAGNIWTVQVPISQLQKFIAITQIDYIQLDEPIASNLDAAIKSARADSVQNGINLPLAYSGKGVVVGIIDAGFDYTHPTFYDTSGTNLRIKRVWEQHNDGTPPIGYNYGNEISDNATMLAKGFEVNSFSHGTHVGGIAAGSGYGTNKKYRGLAYESDLVVVGIKPEKTEWKTSGMASILDGMNYIYNYAKSVNKPAVVNLSWGNSIGPNDGSSLFSQACNNMVGEGKIFVLSAGNNGDENIHVQKTFTNTDTALHSFVTFPTINGEKRNWIDVWGEVGKQFCLKISLYNGSIVSSATTDICLNNNTLDTFLVGSKNDTCFLTITAKAADYNGKPHILVDVFSKTADRFCVSVLGQSGLVHMWQGFVNDYNGYYGEFTAGGFPWGTAGNSNYTLGEMASTQSAITVAAYASKIAFKNLAGSNQSYSGYAFPGQITPFSSKGPTVDGRIKPDIAAPGMTIASAVNSFDVSYLLGGSNYAQSVAKFTFAKNNREYYYAEASGTSMSSPMVTGIVALLLQANPKLTQALIKDIIFKTAITDIYTKQPVDSSRWGAGKINAYAAIKRTIATIGVTEQKFTQTQVNLFPNPTTGSFQLYCEAIQNNDLQVTITDIMGKTIQQHKWTASAANNTLTIDLGNENKGVYIVSIGNGSSTEVRKVLVY